MSIFKDQEFRHVPSSKMPNGCGILLLADDADREGGPPGECSRPRAYPVGRTALTPPPHRMTFRIQ